MTQASTPAVYSAMVAVMEDIGKAGIAKARKNQTQGYNFRGIDDVYNELNSLLAKHKLLMLPTVASSDQVERTTKQGGAIFYTRLVVDFKLISAVDGSSETVRVVGEAMDNADKSSNKAQSAAYKYAAMQVFCIPTEGDNDADATTHEVAPKAAQVAAKAEPPKATLGQRANRLESALEGAKTADDLRKVYSLASGLCADLDLKDPERLAEIEKVYADRFAALADADFAKTPELA